ncbi:MAG: tRNA1(Val) (adenine(37)-N6)-methyltransferase [Alphaproteobacteria bacterium]
MRADLTRDHLLGGRVVLFQPRRGYRVAIDPVLLAACVPAKGGDRVLDVGAGTGAAALCLARRVRSCRVTAFELQPRLAALARKSIAVNALEGRIEVVEGDLSRPLPALGRGAFDHVMANPPHRVAGKGPSARDSGRAAALVEGESRLDHWLDFCFRMARSGGTITVLHRADRLAELMSYSRMSGAVVFPLWSKAGEDAKRVIVQWLKGRARGSLRLAAGMVLHETNGAYTASADRVLREGLALEL